MTLSYFSRLLCVCLASFFVIHVVLSIGIRVASQSALRMAGAAKLPRALQVLVALRVLPAMAGLFAVLLLCIPSYLTYEPAATREEVGVLCCVAAILAIGLVAESIFRSARAVIGTWRFTRACRQNGKFVKLGGERSPVLVVDSEAPILTLAGVFRPQLVASVSVLRGLSRDELSAALTHERGHRSSRDNMWRLFLMSCPRLPFGNGTRELEEKWARWVEWRADDFAAAEDPERSLSLASALVHIARLGVSHPTPPLCANFVSAENELEQRVERLLRTGSENEQTPRAKVRKSIRGFATVIAAAGVLGIAQFQPAILHSVHEILEKLIR